MNRMTAKQAVAWMSQPGIMASIHDHITRKDEATIEARGGPVKPGLYRHFKGVIYKVIANGFMEKDNTPVVVYENPKTGKVWVRSLLDFNTMVQGRGLDGPGDLVPRFTYLGGRK